MSSVPAISTPPTLGPQNLSQRESEPKLKSLNTFSIYRPYALVWTPPLPIGINKAELVQLIAVKLYHVLVSWSNFQDEKFQ